METPIFQKKKARTVDKEFTIEDLPPVPEFCIITEFKLHDTDSYADDAIELDRVDSSKGYIPGNIVWKSRKAYRIKSDCTREELITFRIHYFK